MTAPSSPTALPGVITRFLAAVDARDAQRVGECFVKDGAYHFLMPHPAVVGREAIEAAFARVFAECTEVQWDVSSFAVNGALVFLERVDRFLYDGREAAIECLGVFEIEGDLVSAARDYADCDTWQRRKTAAQAPQASAGH